jgi:hypothetical protein
MPVLVIASHPAGVMRGRMTGFREAKGRMPTLPHRMVDTLRSA